MQDQPFRQRGGLSKKKKKKHYPIAGRLRISPPKSNGTVVDFVRLRAAGLGRRDHVEREAVRGRGAPCHALKSIL
jgi:hypothetical protein